ncbi:MAG: hypothetical protein V3W41_14390 [Planctomycetota bacterium]
MSDLQAEIVTTRAILDAISAAIQALADPTISSYTLDTGQTQQRVSRENLPQILQERRRLQSDLCALENRLTGAGVTRGQPLW